MKKSLLETLRSVIVSEEDLSLSSQHCMQRLLPTITAKPDITLHVCELKIALLCPQKGFKILFKPPHKLPLNRSVKPRLTPTAPGKLLLPPNKQTNKRETRQRDSISLEWRGNIAQYANVRSSNKRCRASSTPESSDGAIAGWNLNYTLNRVDFYCQNIRISICLLFASLADSLVALLPISFAFFFPRKIYTLHQSRIPRCCCRVKRDA